MRNVVVQWARLGDLLQTRILLRKIAESSPGSEVILCGDAGYRELARAFPEITDYWPVELSRLSALARHTESHTDFMTLFAEMALDLSAKPVDAAYVMTRSLAAITFAELLNPVRMIGYTRQGLEICVPPQLAGLDSQELRGTDKPLHLADLWATFADGPQTARWLPPLEWTVADQTASPAMIGIFCDAGEAHRMIPSDWLEYLVERWAQHDSTTIHLFGKASQSDSLSGIAASSKGRIVDLRGQTPLPVLCDRLAECSLVVGADTGGLHLAAALNIPVVGLYFGGARPELTGPYASQVRILQDPSWTRVDAQDVISAGRRLMGGDDGLNSEGTFASFAQPCLTETGIFYMSASASETDEAPIALSIVIPECGAAHYTDQLLQDLSTQDGIQQCEVILVTSGDSAMRIIPSYPSLRITTLRSNEALSFALACNRGAESAAGDDLLFLNNDTRLTRGTIQGLLLAANPEEIISPLILYPDGLIQNAGVMISGGEIREIDHGSVEQTRYASQPDAVSAIAMLLSRALFVQNGGFDACYVNGYEDLDFCLRAGRQGARCRVHSTVKLVHFRSSTQGRFDFEDDNKSRFVNTWASVLERAPQSAPLQKASRVAPLLIVSHESASAAGSCLRWIWPLQDLGLVQDRDFVWISEAEAVADLNAYRQAVESAQGIIVFRPLLHHDVERILQDHIDRTGTPLCVDSDDLIIRRFPSVSPRGMARSSYEAGFISLLQRASMVTASTPPLVESLQHFGLEASLLSTRPNTRQRRSVDRRIPQPTVNMGFFGTLAHLVDLGDILPALEDVLEANPHLNFFWWGCRPGNLVGHPQVRQGGPVVTDYSDHLYRLHNFPLDFVIVPLLDAPSCNVRSAIKYFEYALAGLPAVYSAVKPYTDYITDQHNGLLVENTTPAWFDALNIMANQPEIRTCLARNAEHDMTDRLSGSRSRQSLRRLIADLLRGRGTVTEPAHTEGRVSCVR